MDHTAKYEKETNDKKKQILDAARFLFLEEGYQKVSMRKIANKIGSSATTIYIYYKNKEEILIHLLEEGFSLFYNDLKAACQQPSASNEVKLYKLCEAYILFGLKYPDYYKIIFTNNLENNTTIFVKEKSDRYKGFQLLQQIVKGLIDENTFAKHHRAPELSVDYISQSIWAQLHGLTSLLIAFPKFSWIDQDDLISFYVQSLIRGFKMDHG